MGHRPTSLQSDPAAINQPERYNIMRFPISLFFPYDFNISLWFFSSDPCDSVSCQNEGTCSTIDGSFLCNCLSGYTGIYCETGIHFIFLLFQKEITKKDNSHTHNN